MGASDFWNNREGNRPYHGEFSGYNFGKNFWCDWNMRGGKLDLIRDASEKSLKNHTVSSVRFKIRCATAYGAVSCCGYNVKERLFIALSWIPKATVQVNKTKYSQIKTML